MKSTITSLNPKAGVILKTWLLILLLLPASTSFGQSINANWKKDMNALLDQYLKCAGTAENNYSCSAFISESIAKVYKVNNVYVDKLKRFKLMNEMSEVIAEPTQWTLLGYAYDQKILDQAQTLANASKAVVAVYHTAEGVKHIALILPGDLQFSGTWGFKVPNAASFMLNDPTKSFVEKSLSYAFSRSMIKDVKLYSKIY